MKQLSLGLALIASMAFVGALVVSQETGLKGVVLWWLGITFGVTGTWSMKFWDVHKRSEQRPERRTQWRGRRL